MPEYLYQCPAGHAMSRFTTIKNHQPFVDCEHCGVIAQQVLTAPIMVKASADVCYDSPIDGSPITSWAARREDLARNNCVPYEPGQKQDYHRCMDESEQHLDRALSESVEQAIEQMPTQKRGKLYSEMYDQGMTTTVERSHVDG